MTTTRFALVVGAIVQSVTDQETDKIDDLPDLGGQWVACSMHIGPGWTFNGAEFAAPVVPDPAEDPRLWWIDVGPFKDRLGMDAPAIGASSHSACKGVVEMLNGRKYVNLKDPRVLAMLNALIATNQPAADPVWPGSGPMTASKRDAILETPTTEEERHIKGLPS